MIETCATCANRAPSKEMEPPVVNPDRVAIMRPMQEIAVDYAEYSGKNFLIMADRFSSCAFCEETKVQDNENYGFAAASENLEGD